MIEQTLVIGATGLVGRHVVAHLVEQGRTVVGTRRWNSDVEVLNRLGVADIVVDLDDLDELAHAVSGVNHIIYCAAPDTSLESGPYLRRSVRWIRNVLKMARQEDVGRVVVTSTAATVARRGSGKAAEDQRPDAREVYLPGSAEDPFVEAAYAVEQEVFRQAADGQSVVILNPTVVVGDGARLPAPGALEGVGAEAPVNWVDAGRVARAHEAALQHGRRGGRYVIGGTDGTLEELYDVVERHPGCQTVGAGLLSGPPACRNRYLLTHGQWVDPSRANRILGL